jgi:hypothetical protein
VRVVSKRLRFVVAQLGYKPGARARLSRCLDAADLPFGPWHRIDQRSYRTGYANRGEPWADKARASRCLSVWRSFVNSEAGRYLQVSVARLVEQGDLPTAIESTKHGRLPNLHSRVSAVGAFELDPAPQLAGAQNVYAIEEATRGPWGPGTNLTLRFSVGLDVVALGASAATGRGSGWGWDELVQIATLQIARLTSP